MKSQKHVRLDWNRLLGFDQVGDRTRRLRLARAGAAGSTGATLRLSSLGAKISVKPGFKSRA